MRIQKILITRVGHYYSSMKPSETCDGETFKNNLNGFGENISCCSLNEQVKETFFFKLKRWIHVLTLYRTFDEQVYTRFHSVCIYGKGSNSSWYEGEEGKEA